MLRLLPAYLSIIVVVIVVYHNSLMCHFAFDDSSAIVDNQDLRPKTPWMDLFKNDFWGTPLSREESHKSYRPLTVFTFRLNYFLHKLNPVGYHCANVLLHTIVCILYMVVLKSGLKIRDSVAKLASMLFVIHPIHTEAVAGVVGRAELLCSVFFLLALLAYLGNTLWGCLLCLLLTFAGTFSKEQGITVLGLCFACEFLVKKEGAKSESCLVLALRRLTSFRVHLRLFFLIGTGIFVLSVRLVALKGSLPAFMEFDNPAAANATPIRQLTYNYLVALNFWLLLCPWALCADWTMGTVPLVQEVADIRNFATLGCYFCFSGLFLYFLCAKIYSDGRFLVLALLWTVIPFIPASNLFFPVGFVVAERVLYIPSMGFCLFISLVFHQTILKMRPRFGKILILLLLVCFSAKTYIRNFDWRDDWTLFRSALKITRNNAKIFNNLGHYLEAKGEYSDALNYFLSATEIQPNDMGAWINVGRSYNSLTMIKDAEKAFLMAKSLLPRSKNGKGASAHVAPSSLSVFLNLGNLYRNQSKVHKAMEMYRQALAMRPEYLSAYINLGDIYLSQEKFAEAKAIFAQGLHYHPRSPDLLYNMGIVFLRENNTKNALKQFEMALNVDSEHSRSLINSALILASLPERRFQEKAVERLEKALDLRPIDAALYRQLGSLQFELNHLEAAEKAYEKATILDPTSKTAFLNLGLIQMETSKNALAYTSFVSALNLDPSDAKALLSLCDLTVHHLKNETEGMLCYRKVLKTSPRNVQARHNLCILYINQNLLEEAKSCVLEAETLVNVSGAYTSKHIAVLKDRLNKI